MDVITISPKAWLEHFTDAPGARRFRAALLCVAALTPAGTYGQSPRTPASPPAGTARSLDSLPIAARIPTGAPTIAGDLAVGGSAVWYSADGVPVIRIDPVTNRVTDAYVGGSGADAIRVSEEAVWVADHRHNEVWRIPLAEFQTGHGPADASHSRASDVARAPSLVGVWRVAKFCDDDSTGRLVEPFGPNPTGYFIYTPTGQLSIQMMRTPPVRPFAAGDDQPTDAERRELLDAYFGYYGTYTITSDSTVEHHIQGGTFPSYIGTPQLRLYQIRGDTLAIGSSRATFDCRVLVRAGVEE